MISLYRWKPGQAHGTWVELTTLPEEPRVPEGEVWWLDLDDPSEEEEALIFRRLLKVHPLTVEDITRPRREPDGAAHLPKVEEFPDYLFVIVNALKPPAEGERASVAGTSQLSAVLTENVLITHHYNPLPAIISCQQLLFRHAAHGSRGPDYLFHLVLDVLVDEYAPEVDRLVERLDEIELTVLDAPSREAMSDLIHLKRRVVGLRKTLILQREVLARLIRGEFALVDEREIAYYRNVFDHLVRYTELIEGAREMVSDLIQTHLAAVSNQLNSIMKVLTMISTVILPMTLVAGIYGMNFENMPELKWQYGYYFALGLMALVGIIPLVIYFIRKRW